MLKSEFHWNKISYIWYKVNKSFILYVFSVVLELAVEKESILCSCCDPGPFPSYLNTRRYKLICRFTAIST